MPDFRFVVGAMLATAVIAVTSIGLIAATRLAHHTKVGPLETARGMGFDDGVDWNQFQDPDAARRFELARKPQVAGAASAPAPETPAEPAPPATAPAAGVPVVAAGEKGERDYDHALESIAPVAAAMTEI